MFNPTKVKQDFPIFEHKFNGKELVYLDNAATTQKPTAVLDAIVDFYSNSNSNVSRSSHFLADIAVDNYNDSRKTVANYLNAHESEIVFTKNATESLNLVAFSWGMENVNEGDVIITTDAEHNSSLLPWKGVSKARNAEIKYLSIDKKGNLKDDWSDVFDDRVKVVVISQASNVLGSLLPVKQIVKESKKSGAVVVIDGSQAVAHESVDVMSLGCDFYAFSGHKIMGPMGIGVLYGKKKLLDEMTPLYYGGGIVKDPEITKDSLVEAPFKFESGTPNVAGAAGLSAAIGYMSSINAQSAYAHVFGVSKYAIEQLSLIEKVNILGPKDPNNRIGLVSFVLDGIHSHDVASVLSSEGVAVRSGMQCSMHLYENLNIPASTRASFYVYNTMEDVDKLVEGVKKALKILE